MQARALHYIDYADDGYYNTAHGTKDARTLSKLELETDDYYFGLTFLRGNPGQKLTLMIENEVSTLHNITISALGIDKDIAAQRQGGAGCHLSRLGRANLLVQVPRTAGDGRIAQGGRIPPCGLRPVSPTP